MFFAGAIASGINTVAGGGSLISFPALTLGLGLDSKVANATNSVGLWPGSLSGAIGYLELLPKTKHHLRLLVLPTLVGAAIGAWLLVITGKAVFDAIVPVLLLLATALLWFQPQVKKYVANRHGKISPVAAVLGQSVVGLYGGFFGAGMGIMMLAIFTLFMEGTIQEINAVKNWLGVFINVVASGILIAQGLVVPSLAISMALGSIVGGFLAARWSMKVDSEKLRVGITVYGLVTALYFAWRTWA
jgi:uncharacterized protein